MKKSSLYKVHRYLSVICLIPVLLWCISGLTHPIMANWFRIQPAHRAAPITKIDTTKIQYSLQTIVAQNKINSFENIGVKSFNNALFYLIEKENKVSFYNANSGDKLEKGDLKYASFLAKYYLGKEKAEVVNITVVESFTQDYKIINRHLPVYKVSFNDEAKSDVFVHLPSGSLGTINDGFRRTQLWIFSNFHNWSFLGENHTIKPFIVFTLSLLTFVVGVLGLFIYFINRKKYKKRKKGVEKLKRRNLHRYISIPVSVFFLMFSFSGTYHAFQKFEEYNLNQYQPVIKFNVDNIKADFFEIENLEKLQRISLVTINDEVFYRTSFSKNAEAKYYHTTTLKELKNGDQVYAKQRAVEITKKESSEIKEVHLITKFENRYGFINKRLPVYEVAFNDDLQTSCFLETASGIPGSLVDKIKKREALSFIMLHKFHFLDFLGKGTRDIIIALAILSVLLILFSGLRVFIQMVKRR